MADDWGLMENYDEPARCSECEGRLEWAECEQCGGEGEYDCYEEDPLWYDEGDTKPCAQCGGAGGWYWCPQCSQED